MVKLIWKRELVLHLHSNLSHREAALATIHHDFTTPLAILKWGDAAHDRRIDIVREWSQGLAALAGFYQLLARTYCHESSYWLRFVVCGGDIILLSPRRRQRIVRYI
ncbi:MAG: hypothetical protein R3E08_07270 [Thiotrichaceae bacterium]